MKNSILLLGLVFFLSSLADGQTKQTKKQTVTLTPPPGNIRLLPGYSHKKLPGRDSDVGYISREGVTVHYDIGGMAANYIYLQRGEEVVWQMKQTLNNREFIAVRTKNKIYVTFTKLHAYFSAEVETENEAMEVLFMVLTYKDEPDCPKKT